MASVEAPGLNINNYLEQRAADSSFVMVEIGHGRHPLVAQQPHQFTGQQAYIGIEAGMRGRVMADDRADRYRKEHTAIHAFFLMHSLGDGEVYRNGVASDEWYAGDFEVETILPEKAADEVVASNVFCDPLIARNFGYTMALLGEAARLVTPDGTIVLRETTTPGEVTYLQDYTVKHVGLEILQRITPSNERDWENLEQVYGTHNGMQELNPYPNAYYLFLGRVADAESGGQA